MRKTTQITIVPKGEPIFADSALVITVMDEATGPFLSICMAGENEVRIDFDEWNEVDAAVRSLITEHS